MILIRFLKRAILGLLLFYMLAYVMLYYRHLYNSATPISLSVGVRQVEEMFDYLEKNRLRCPLVCPYLVNGKETENDRYNLHCPKADDENNHKRFEGLLMNCSQFLENRGYILNPITQEEEDFPLAFNLLVYSSPYQVETLLRAIYRPQNYYCIHIDSKVKTSFKQAMFALCDCLPNVFVAERLVLVKWGSFGVVDAELSCMKDLLRFKKWKYLINLTGQEFPLKTNLQIVRILKVLNGANDINTIITPKKWFRIRYNYNDDGIVLSKKGPPPFNLTFLSGSTHISATHAFVDFLINNPKAKIYLNWLNGTKIPDETVFSMLNGNPQIGVPGAYKGPLKSINDVPFLSRYKIWSNQENATCGGYFRRGVCVLNMRDLPRLVTAFNLFANKFAGSCSNSARACLDEWLFNRTRDEYLSRYTFDLKKYQHLPQAYPQK